ncbi:PepSY-associated TM helix domain-containing protein [Tahibacter amnicola]|uniref:PepSY-associated TM helix domain-containing protein n=1 Tax=Tahibacter amnicola TaxID=2976241 RepID=A0ABY6BAS0_9GAMM|nr:PepSY-associated TM helix domain-containing protein [Tahibacter amnicola]UXI67163.1 PepSY-associated TM helix domain-containing protein [Tahibacter amnicola]
MSVDDPQRPSGWLKTLLRWHWISSAVSLIGLLAFAVTGVTLNHAAQIPAKPVVTRLQAEVPAPVRDALAAIPEGGELPGAVREWVQTQFPVHLAAARIDVSPDDITISLPRPGGDSWVSIDPVAGTAEYERTDRGWIAWFNDLHKGRNTGPAWTWFIDLFALACIVFAVTGLLLLQLHAARRPQTWPLVALGLLVPLVLVLAFVH